MSQQRTVVQAITAARGAAQQKAEHGLQDPWCRAQRQLDCRHEPHRQSNAQTANGCPPETEVSIELTPSREVELDFRSREPSQAGPATVTGVRQLASCRSRARERRPSNFREVR